MTAACALSEPTTGSSTRKHFMKRVGLLASWNAVHFGKNPTQKDSTPCGYAIGEWVILMRSIRNGARKDLPPLTAWEIEQLDAAGIIWHAKRGRPGVTGSNSLVDEVARTVATLGHADVLTGTVSQNGSLTGYRLRNARTAAQNGTLDERTEQDLRAMDVTFRDPENPDALRVAARTRFTDRRFAQMLSALDASRAAHNGRWPCADDTFNGEPVGRWLADVRATYRDGDLDVERSAALDERGIDWHPKVGRGDFARFLPQRLVCLARYVAVKGDGDVPRDWRCDHDDCERKDLGGFVNRCRKRYAGTDKRPLSQEEIAALEEAGISWSKRAPRSEWDRLFPQRIVCFKSYRARTGSGRPPVAETCDHDECERKNIGEFAKMVRRRLTGKGKAPLPEWQWLECAAAGIDR